MSIILTANPRNRPVATQPARSLCSPISSLIKLAAKVGLAILVAAPFAAATPSQTICPVRPFNPFPPEAVPLRQCEESAVCEMKGETLRCLDSGLKETLREGKQEIQSSQRGSRLWDQIEQNGTPTFRVTDLEIRPGKAPYWRLNPEIREILISPAANRLQTKTAMREGLLELWNLDRKNVDRSNVICDNKSRRSQIETARKTLLKCSESRALLQEVTSHAPFKFHCTSLGEAAGLALTKYRPRQILIGTQKTSELFAAFILELGNLKRALEVNALEDCNIGAATYARKREQIEYGALKEAHQILTACIDQGVFPKGTNPFALLFSGKVKSADFRTFEGYLAQQINTGHTKVYEDQYRQQCFPSKKIT